MYDCFSVSLYVAITDEFSNCHSVVLILILFSIRTRIDNIIGQMDTMYTSCPIKINEFLNVGITHGTSMSKFINRPTDKPTPRGSVRELKDKLWPSESKVHIIMIVKQNI